MSMKRGLFLIVLFGVLLSSSVFAITPDVCPIGCTHNSIQAAINNASNGDTILVGDGTYNEQVTINKNNLNIQSINGASFTIITPTDTSAGGIWIQGNGNTFDGFKVRDFSDTAYEKKIIRIDGNNSIIKNNIIQGNLNQAPSHQTEYGILIYGIDNLIENNEIYDIGYTGINVVGQPHSIATNNIIKNNNLHNIVIYAITIDRSPDNEITENQISNLVGGTLNLFNEGSDFYNCSIWCWGIIVWGENSQGTKIYNQDLVNLPNGITISAAKKIQIKDSTISGNNNIGIKLSKSSWLTGKVEDNEILNNIIIDNDYGIWISSGNSSEMGKNKINYNLISGNNIGLNSSAPVNINATYNNWGSCNGPDGIGPGTGDSVYGNVTYAPWLGTCITNKTKTPSCVLATDNVILSVNITGYCIDNVKFGIKIGSGSWNNYSGVISYSGIGNYSYTINSILLHGNETVFWTVYADDCYNHTTQNGIVYFNVNKRTNLSLNPTNPNGLNNWYVTEPIFTLTNLDANKIWYRWDSTPNILYMAPFNLSKIPNPPPVSAGILELTYWGNLSCRLEPEQSKIFKVDLTNPQFTNLNPANNSIVINNNKPIISAYIDEIWQSNSGINLNSVKMKVDGNVVPANVSVADSLDAVASFLPSTDLSQGIHTVYINATDNSGRYSETQWKFNISFTTAFSLNITSPENKTYGEKKMRFDLFTSNEVEKIEYADYTDRILRWKKLCSSCSSYNKTKSLRDGTHILSFKATDYYGASSIINVTFMIDSIKPKIKNIEPKSNSFSNGQEFLIKYDEENLKEIILFYGNNTQTESKTLINCTTSGENQICMTDANLSIFNGQKIEYWFVVSDFIRNVSSVKKKINVDTIVPIVNVIAPQNGGSYGNNVPFKINVSEKVELRYSVDNIKFKSLCRNCDVYDNYRTFDDGNYNIIIKAEDKAGNLVSVNRNFTVT